MRHEQLTYPDALRWIARRYHIEIQEKELTEEQKREQTERESMFIVNQWAAEYFSDILHNDIDGRAIGMQYFRQRGIRDDIIQKFQLGFCLSDRSAMSKAALNKGYNKEYLTKTGLCYARDGHPDELVDRFAGRVMFPWIGVSGKVVAFGGRVLDSRTKGVAQKYVNSPDSEIYHKDHELYGIFQAKKAIAKEDLVYMVEGYTDVISMHQCGIENVVANSGTALSEHQIHILHRFTQNIVLLYDGDAAGIKAALRGTDMLLKEGMNVKVMLLPDGDDPDSFARKHTADDFRNYIKENQSDFIAFKTRVMLDGVTDPHKRSEAITSIIESISVISDPIVRATYVQDCSVRLGINEQTLMAKLREVSPNATETPRPAAPPPATAETKSIPEVVTHKPDNKKDVSYLIMRLIIKQGDQVLYDDVETEDGKTTSLTVAQFIKYDLEQDGLQFSKDLYNNILNEAVEHSGESDFNTEKYFTMHADYTISSFAISISADEAIVSESLKREMKLEDLRNQVTHLLYDFRGEYINNKMMALRNEMLANKDNPERIREVMNEMKELQKIRMAIAKKTGRSVH
jgi:DNA primase